MLLASRKRIQQDDNHCVEENVEHVHTPATPEAGASTSAERSSQDACHESHRIGRKPHAIVFPAAEATVDDELKTGRPRTLATRSPPAHLCDDGRRSSVSRHLHSVLVSLPRSRRVDDGPIARTYVERSTPRRCAVTRTRWQPHSSAPSKRARLRNRCDHDVPGQGSRSARPRRR
jgi:hypothetical protein